MVTKTHVNHIHYTCMHDHGNTRESLNHWHSLHKEKCNAIFSIVLPQTCIATQIL